MNADPDQELHSDFRPRRWLHGAHMQTLAGNFMRRGNGLPAPEERLFQVEPETQVMCHCHWQPEEKRASALTLIIVHGLEGSSHSQYVVGTGSKAWALGWNVVRMNIRNCGGTEKLSKTLYHSGLYRDIEFIASALISDYKLKHIAIAGFSMGGNQVLRCAGEWGKNTPPQVAAIIGVSPSCDLSISSDEIHRAWNRIYEWWFLIPLRKRMRRKAQMFPGHFDLKLLKKATSIRAFDEHFTARYMGFEGAEDYYTKASSSRVIDKIAVPTLVIHASDDPFIVLSPETQEKLRRNPNIKFIYTKHGGHCAFLADPHGYDGRWAEQQIIKFLRETMEKRRKDSIRI